jgi:hypothetical protein
MPKFQEELETIKDKWEIVEQKGQEALEAIIDIGENLAVVRKWLDDRNQTTPKEKNIAWEEWCKRNLPFGKRQANRYLKICRNKKKIKFSQDEKVSVRAALVMIQGGKRRGETGLKAVVRGKGPLKARIEAGPTGGVTGGRKSHRIRLTWRDDEVGEYLHKQGEKEVSSEDGETLAGACARLFGLALDQANGQLGRRICLAIRNSLKAPYNTDALMAVLQALEFRGASFPIGTGPSGATGPMPPHQAFSGPGVVNYGQPVAART